MKPNLKAFSLYPEPNDIDLISEIGLTAKKQQDHLEKLIESGVIGTEALKQEDKRLAGMILSVLLEGELLTFLEKQRKTDQPNYRNGYLKRTIETNSGTLSFIVSRDRKGEFEPSLVQPYKRNVELNVEDLLSLAVNTGYSHQERMALIKNIYEKSGCKPESFENSLSMVESHFDLWNNSLRPYKIRIGVGFVHHAVHEIGIRKTIVGIRSLERDGSLTGMLALAGTDKEVPILAQKIVQHLFNLKVQAPTILILPEQRTGFASAAARYWPHCSVLTAKGLVY